MWAASIAPGFDTGQLYVNGARMSRSSGLPSAYYLQTSTGFISSTPVLAGWRHITNVSAVFNGGNGAWTQTSCPIASVSGRAITMAQPCWGNLHLPGDGSQEVSWVYGPQGGSAACPVRPNPRTSRTPTSCSPPATGRSTPPRTSCCYVPTPGQSMATASVIAPVLGDLLEVKGTLDTPVHDLAFDGLQFSYATWTQPDTAQGFAEMQADWTLTGPNAAKAQGTCSYSIPPGTCPYTSWTRTPAAVQLSATHDVTLGFDTFSDLGGAGLDLTYGSQGDLVQGNIFTDIAASAIQLGSTDDPAGRRLVPTTARSTPTTSSPTTTSTMWPTVSRRRGIWVGIRPAPAHHPQPDRRRALHRHQRRLGWLAQQFPHPELGPQRQRRQRRGRQPPLQLHGDPGRRRRHLHQRRPGTRFRAPASISGNVAYGGTNTDFSLYTDTGSKYVELTQNVVYDQPVNSFASGGCHTVGHIHLDGNYFSQIGPLYPCDAAVDVVPVDTSLVCNTLAPGQAPTSTWPGPVSNRASKVCSSTNLLRSAWSAPRNSSRRGTGADLRQWFHPRDVGVLRHHVGRRDHRAVGRLCAGHRTTRWRYRSGHRSTAAGTSPPIHTAPSPTPRPPRRVCPCWAACGAGLAY